MGLPSPQITGQGSVSFTAVDYTDESGPGVAYLPKITPESGWGYEEGYYYMQYNDPYGEYHEVATPHPLIETTNKDWSPWEGQIYASYGCGYYLYSVKSIYLKFVKIYSFVHYDIYVRLNHVSTEDNDVQIQGIENSKGVGEWKTYKGQCGSSVGSNIVEPIVGDGWKFKHWEKDGEVVSTDTEFDFSSGDYYPSTEGETESHTIYAVFEVIGSGNLMCSNDCTSLVAHSDGQSLVIDA